MQSHGQSSRVRVSPQRRNKKLIHISRENRRILLSAFFIVQVVAITFGQKIAIGIDLSAFGLGNFSAPVQVALPIFLFSLVVMAILTPPKIDLMRVLAFLVFLAFLAVSIALQRAAFSTTSLILMLVLYVPFVLKYEISQSSYRSMLNIFNNIIAVFCVIVLLQQIVQLLFSPNYWPNLDKMLGDNFILPGYNYIQPIKFGSRLMKPSGVFFLEVSLLSQWIAIALAIEVIYFQRFWRIALCAIAMLATFAGTGILLILLSLPFLLLKLPRRMAVILLLFIPIIMYGVQKFSWLDTVQHRFTEYKVAGGSANHRFVEPAEILLDNIARADHVFTGDGPGSGQKTEFALWWPSTKLVFEYGTAVAIAFMVFLSVCFFRGAPSKRLAFMLFIQYNIMSEFIVPCYVILFAVMVVLFRVREESVEPDPMRGPLLKKVLSYIKN